MYDSLDTMWLMGLHDKFRESLEMVAKADFGLKEVSTSTLPMQSPSRS